MTTIRKYGDPPWSAAAIHGGPGAPGSAAGLARGLAAATGAGVLEPFQSKRTIRALVEELYAQLAAESAGPVMLIGHSWGAWLSAMFAQKYPEKVRKLLLVGCGPLTDSYVPKIAAGRMARLNERERRRFAELPALLARPDCPGRDALIAELGALCERSDAYAPMKSGEAPSPAPDGALYQAVWSEAVELRRSGKLLQIFERLNVPVTVIHGDADPHPAAGVREPLRSLGVPFTFHLLPRCGHTPWEEKFAREPFFRLLAREFSQKSFSSGSIRSR